MTNAVRDLRKKLRAEDERRRGRSEAWKIAGAGLLLIVVVAGVVFIR